MQTDPIAVLGAIGAQLRRLYYARVILSAGGGQKELMELTGLKSYPAGLTMTAARRVTDGFCQRAIELALDTDIAMKTSADEPERSGSDEPVRLSRQESRAFAWGAVKAALLVTAVFSVAAVLFILFCTDIWFV